MSEEHVGDLTGQRLGNYRINGVLGKGGMSVMYRATDVRLGRKVALKVIGAHLGADAEFRERFVDEARNTSAIDHPNVVPLYDFGELDGMHYIAMRLVEGSDLASLIAAGPMEKERAVSLLEQVADALDSMHSRGLVHLDVKPANVLVAKRQAVREHVYVADFGLTRRGATGHRTRGGDFLGSPTYAAPEHLRGEALDGRTDQYALACVLYACLTGRPPFSGDVQAVIKGHLNAEPTWASTVVGALPAAIDPVIGKGMAKNPHDRYPNCVELMSAARAVLLPQAGRAAPQGNGQLTPGRPAAAPQLAVRHGPAQRGAVHPAQGPFGALGVPAQQAYGVQQGPPPHVMPPGYPAPPPAPSAPAPGPGYPGWLIPTLIGTVVVLVIALALAL